MAKLKSTEVKVFPSAFRGLATGTKYNPEARLNTEFNVTNLTNRLASKDSFVISWNDESETVKFNIHGYYFELELEEFLSSGAGSNWTNVYARIRLLPFITEEDSNTKYKAFTLASVDENDSTLPPSGKILDVTTSSIDTFFGVELSDSATTPLADTDYELHLLTRTAIPNTSPQEYTSWAVPLTSYLKFVATDVEGLPKINNDLTLDTSDTIFAPITAGTSGQVLVSAGGTSAPVWANQSTVVAGQAAQLTTARTLWGQSFDGTANIDGTIENTNSITPKLNNVSSVGSSSKVYANVYATTFTGNLTGNVTGDVSGNAGTVTNGIYTTSSSGQSITVSDGNGLEVIGSSVSGNAYGIYGRASAFLSDRSIGVIANGYGSGDSWGLAITRGATTDTDDGLNSDHIRFRGTRNNIKFLSDGTPNPSAASYIAIEPASLAASRTYTLPDAGTNADFVMTQGNQTIAGTKTFTGTPLAPTAANTVNNTQIATTAFVRNKFTDFIKYDFQSANSSPLNSIEYASTGLSVTLKTFTHYKFKILVLYTRAGGSSSVIFLSPHGNYGGGPSPSGYFIPTHNATPTATSITTAGIKIVNSTNPSDAGALTLPDVNGPVSASWACLEGVFYTANSTELALDYKFGSSGAGALTILQDSYMVVEEMFV
jgi:hypothetical protein